MTVLRKLWKGVFFWLLFVTPFWVIVGWALAAAPTLTSATIAANGATWTFVYSEAVEADTTAELCTDYSVTMSIVGAITLAYASGTGTDTVVCTGDKVVTDNETATAGLDYTPGSVVNGGAESLAAINDDSVTNDSIITVKFVAAQDQTYTAAVLDLTDANWDIGLLIPAGATGVTFDRVTLVNPYASGLALRADETLFGTGTLYSGTATIANGAMFSFDNTTPVAFAYMDNQDLSQYEKLSGNRYRITVTDSTGGAGHFLTGYIGPKDIAYAVGVEKITNGSMEAGSPPSSWSLQNGATLSSVADERSGGAGSASLNALRGTANLAANQSPALTAGGLYAVDIWLRNVDAASGTNAYFGKSSGTVTATDWTNKTWKMNWVTGYYFAFYVLSAGNARLDDVSVKQVTSSSADGVRVYNAATGGTEGWVTTDGASFNYNSSTYTVTVSNDNSTSVRNSIIKGGGSGLDMYVATGKTAAGDYNAFPNHASAMDRYTGGGHDVFASDPVFYDAGTGDYRLKGSSPCRDKGTGSEADIRGYAVFEKSDIGAYEYQPPMVIFSGF